MIEFLLGYVIGSASCSSGGGTTSVSVRRFAKGMLLFGGACSLIITIVLFMMPTECAVSAGYGAFGASMEQFSELFCLHNTSLRIYFAVSAIVSPILVALMSLYERRKEA